MLGTRHATTSICSAAISLFALVSAPGAALAQESRPEVLDVVGLPAPDAERPTSVYMVIPPAPEQKTDVTPKAAKYIIYMNRNGGTYTPGFNDSRNNRSSIPVQTTTIRPWSASDATWNRVMDCVSNVWAPYNVEITDVDPGNVPHIESVVAGRPQDVGLEAGVAGVSPFTNNCSVIDNSIVFTFAEVLGNDYQFVCEVVAQEVAHSFGLDHEFLCEDPMTYLSGCGAKTFQDVDAQCGEYEARQCYCGGFTQNSVQMLTERIGLAGQGQDSPLDTIAPVVDFSSPADGQVVQPGFIVSVDAVDDVSLSHVELYIDGLLSATRTSAPWTFVTPDLASGSYVLETRAYDRSQNVDVATIAVVVSDSGNPQNSSGLPSDIVGGCQASDQGAGGLTLFLVAMGLALSRRRRRGLVLSRRR